VLAVAAVAAVADCGMQSRSQQQSRIGVWQLGVMLRALVTRVAAGRSCDEVVCGSVAKRMRAGK
ncbi:MAG: hypothetical protein ACKPHU_20630, partial [Planctomycetaceae bacterium]